MYLLHAQSRRLYNDSRPSLPSRFIDEIDPACVVKTNTSVKRSFRKTQESGRRQANAVNDHIDYLPDYEDYSQEWITVEKGTWIAHPKYGRGCVSKIAGTGPKQVIHVRFESGGTKKFIAQFAKFDIIG